MPVIFTGIINPIVQARGLKEMTFVGQVISAVCDYDKKFKIYLCNIDHDRVDDLQDF